MKRRIRSGPTGMAMRVVAVDWSGDRLHPASRIWLAEADEVGRLVRLEAGRDRQAMADHLLALSAPVGDRHATSLTIGLDFGFSFPQWFLHQLGLADAPALWAYAAEHGERWLADCAPPFWGRPGRQRSPADGNAFRRCELAAPRTAGIGPKSMFQIGGAGAVGTGSIRGMPVLHRLHVAGATIWPYTRGRLGGPVVLEIYPRLLTGPVAKSQPGARAALLAARYPCLSPQHAHAATVSEDAFDAAVSALVMISHAAHFADLPIEPDPVVRREGRIWHPAWAADRL